MTLSRVPFLVCEEDGAQIVLPHRTHGGIFVGQPYWPTDNHWLHLVCPLCGHSCAYSQQNIQRGPLRSMAHNLPPTLFWKAEFECGQQNCKFRVLGHTRANGGFSTQQIANLIFAGRPGLTCADGHTLSGDYARPIDISPVLL